MQRFLIEFWKPYGDLLAGLTVFQFLSVVLLAYALVMVATAGRPVRGEAA